MKTESSAPSRSLPRERVGRSLPLPLSRRGFTLLELVVAFSILALFVLPMLHMVHQARIRALRTSLKREVQELAQRELFDQIYDYFEDTAVAGGFVEAMRGTFEEEGHPNWKWEIPYPEIVSQGEQVLLQYTIRVYAPELEAADMRGSQEVDPFTGEPRSNYEMTTWTFPSEAWYLEQQELMSLGIDTGYFGGFYER